MENRVNEILALQIGQMVMQIAVMEAKLREASETIAARDRQIAELQAAREVIE
jgi:hypothetical protein